MALGGMKRQGRTFADLARAEERDEDQSGRVDAQSDGTHGKRFSRARTFTHTGDHMAAPEELHEFGTSGAAGHGAMGGVPSRRPRGARRRPPPLGPAVAISEGTTPADPCREERLDVQCSGARRRRHAPSSAPGKGTTAARENVGAVTGCGKRSRAATGLASLVTGLGTSIAPSHSAN